jgi:hypothetical protein
LRKSIKNPNLDFKSGYMKQNKSLLLCCLLLILSSTATKAQAYAQHFNSVNPYPLPYYDYSIQMITLRSDLPSQSVLMSTLLADKAGDLSPVICAALWNDSGRHLECRSLLKFNFAYLPQLIVDDPSQINSAELILYPLQVSFSQNDENKPSKIIVRRVMDNWVDSATNWINQPSPDSTIKVSKLIKAKNKNYPVSVDVTKLVIKMLRSTNNGFLISLDDIGDSSIASGQSFASPRFEFADLRPLLVIEYKGMARQIFGFNQWDQEMRNLPVTRNSMTVQPAESGPVMEPVKVMIP